MTAVRERAVAVSDTSGAIAFKWTPVPTGFTWFVAVVIPTAPATATAFVYLTGQQAIQCLGAQPSAGVEVVQGQRLEVRGTGFAHTTEYSAFAIGQLFPGPPRGMLPAGPSTLTKLAKSTTTIKVTTLHVLPIVQTVGVFSGRVALLGTTTQVPIIPATRTPAYWEDMKIGWTIWSTEANTGTYIYIGDSAGGTPTGWARIPSGKTKLMGSFSVAWGNAWVARVAGKSGDHVNVWAA